MFRGRYRLLRKPSDDPGHFLPTFPLNPAKELVGLARRMGLGLNVEMGVLAGSGSLEGIKENLMFARCPIYLLCAASFLLLLPPFFPLPSLLPPLQQV
eukprot:1048790-Amorphochlora_amoeboformis.AAC.1